MVRKISGSVSYSDIYLIIGGLIVFGLPYLRISQYKYEAFRKTLLASVLMFVVLFSTGSESSTYIIAFIGVAIWYTAVPWKRFPEIHTSALCIPVCVKSVALYADLAKADI